MSRHFVQRELFFDQYPPELLKIIEAETQRLPAIQKELRSSPGKQSEISEIRQVTAVECGAACLAMILSYYGHTVGITEVQARCGVGRDGLTALDIVKSARLYGLRVRAVSIKPEDFRYLQLPAIIHWEFNHFMIIERWSRKWIDVVDPAQGRRRLSASEFDQGFTGVALLLEPGAQFTLKAARHSLTLGAYIRSFLQIRGTLLQIVFASLLLQIFGLGGPLLTELIIDHIVPAGEDSLLLLVGLGMVLLIGMQGVALFLRSSLLLYLQARIDTRVMLNFLEHLLSLPYRFFQLRLSGDLLSRINSNLVIRNLVTNQLLSFLLDGSTIIVNFVILIVLSRLTATVASGLGLFQIIVLLLTSPGLRRLTQRELEAQGKTQGYLNEVLAGIATLKAAGAEHRAFLRWENLFFAEMNISLRLQSYSIMIGLVLHLVSILSPLLLLLLGAQQVIAGTMSIGTMLALNTLAALFLSPLSSFIESAQDLQTVRAHFSRISDVLEAEPEQDASTMKKATHRLQGQIELRDLSFQYDQSSPPILRHITMNIWPGQKIALVGRTGSGKSTLGRLLVGLIKPTTGSILYDGIPLESLQYQEVRSQFGIVLQEACIFSGSIRENIALNNPALTIEQVSEASHLAAIADDIEKMPMAYETYVAEGGSVFSGGQRQRLAIARALAHKPAVLLLDEATSALDATTERHVAQNLTALHCTQIIIAHRLSTIRHADCIFVLDQGRIVEQGTHQQLMQHSGIYTELVRAQVRSD
ncbi:peptidase domain-containing ABC transporter [Tengunoibacter tsumagoiensis]|uniref:peptidase domain-containing ABC transporter n=1 Tax=Tengunoibacter tsumagoiensis TaxID=2014871 RepID=UPI001FEC292E|nr:peptidase domain-containing ABC transporter [Tengunoibacter tsumagoiensis]